MMPTSTDDKRSLFCALPQPSPFEAIVMAATGAGLPEIRELKQGEFIAMLRDCLRARDAAKEAQCR